MKHQGFEKKMGNLFGLNGVIHSLLDKGICAFQCVGIYEDTVDGKTVWKTKLKFHFLPDYESSTAESPEAIDAAISSILDQLDTQQQRHLPPRTPEPSCRGYIGTYLRSGELLKSGHIFYVTYDTEEDAWTCGDVMNLH